MNSNDVQLRAYLQVLARFRWGIGLWGAGGVVLTLILSFVLPPVYETRTLVLVREPTFSVSLDHRFVNNDRATDQATLANAVYNSIPPLALSDSVLTEVLNTLETPLPPRLTDLNKLREHLHATVIENTNVIRLTVQLNDAQLATDIVNTWTEILVTRGNNLYGITPGEITSLESQLDATETKLERLQGRMETFEATNEDFIMQARLNTLRRTYEDYLRQREDAINLVNFITEFQPQVSTVGGDISDFLLLLNFRLQAFSGTPTNERGAFQFQFGSDVLGESDADTNVSDRLRLLVSGLESRQERLQAVVDTYEVEILMLQGAIARNSIDKENLERDLRLVEEVYTLVQRRLDQIQVGQEFTERTIEVASLAQIPQVPVLPKHLLNAVIGAAVGLLLGVAYAYFVTYWSTDDAPG